MKRVGKSRFISAILLIFFVVTTGTVSAGSILRGETCAIAADEIITGNIFALCQDLLIEGQIDGQLFGLAYHTIITGRVSGDVYLAGGELILDGGDVGDDLHYFGAILRIQPSPESATETEPHGSINGNLIAGTLSARIDPDVTINGGIIGFGYQLLIDGEINGEINYWGSAVFINGSVNGDILLSVGDPESNGEQIETLFVPFGFEENLINPGLVINNTATISGQVEYSGPAKGVMPPSLEREAIYHPILQPAVPSLEEPETIRAYLQRVIGEFSVLIAIAVIGLLLAPRIIQSPLPVLRARPFASFSIGMLSFILSFPIVLISLLLSFLMISVLLLLGLNNLMIAAIVALLTMNLGGAAVFYFVAIYISRAITGMAIGRLLKRIIPGNRYKSQLAIYLATASGIGIVAALAAIPTIGWVVNAVALFLGLGSILIFALEYLRKLRDTNSVRSVASGSFKSPAHAPAGQMNKRGISPPFAPGTKDLPPGFDFEFFEDD